MTRTEVLAQFQKLGIRIENGKVCKADLMRVMGSGVGESDIDEPQKAEFEKLIRKSYEILANNFSPLVHEAQGIAKKHDSSGFEKKGLLEIATKTEEILKTIQEVLKACIQDRKA